MNLTQILILQLLICGNILYAQECPRIFQRGDTLFAVPDDGLGYRWYKNGEVLEGETNPYLIISENGTYAVEVFGESSTGKEVGEEDIWVRVNVSGRVFDPELNPIQGASVVFKDQIAQTDAEGHYYFEPMVVRGGRTWVKIQAPGFYDGQTAFYLFEDGTERSLATMLFPKSDSIVFDAVRGALLYNSDFSLQIPAGAIVDADGNPFEGEVTLNYSYVPPDFPNFGTGMPGGDFLIENGGSEPVMISYGIMALEARSTATGNRLNVRSSTPAQVSVRMPNGMSFQPSAAFWTFNPGTGAWRQTSTVTVQGRTLSGTIDNFNSWTNVDYMGPSGRFLGRILNCLGQPVPTAVVRLLLGGVGNWFGSKVTYADQFGRFGFMNVPANMNLTIQTTNGQATFTLSPGQTLNIGDIQATASNFLASALMMWNDITQTSITLQVFVNGGPPGLTFSIDSVNWQSSRIFNIPNSPGLNPKRFVWIRETNGCVTKITAYLRRMGAGCFLPMDTSIDSLPVYSTWMSAVEAYNQGQTIYRYASCENLSMVLANFICLRELDLSSCNLSQMPAGLESLMGLRTLNLSNNPIDHVPQGAIGLPNLSLLDMRGTLVPESERAGYEAQMPGVTIYWETCDGPNDGWDWAFRGGGSSADFSARIATLPDDGYFAMVGRVGAGASIGDSTVNAGAVFVGAFNRHGNLLWLRTLDANEAKDVVLLPDSSVCVVGTYFNDLDFGNGVTLEGNQWQGGFVCRFDKAGNALWAKSFDGPDDDEFVAIDGHPDGSSIAVAGAFRGFVVFGNDTLQAVGNQDLFWAELNPQGEILRTRTLTGTGDVSAATIAVGTDGTVMLAGVFSDTLNFPGAVLTQAGGFVVKYDTTGNYLWHRRSSALEFKDVAILGDGSCFVVGGFEGTADWEGNALESVGLRDGFYVHLDSNGDLILLRRIGGAGEDKINSLAVYNDSLVYFVGEHGDVFSFAGTNVSNGLIDSFVAKMDISGNEIWCKTIGGGGNDFGYGIGIMEKGNIGVAGSFESQVQAGPQNLVSSGGSDIFWIKLCGN